MKRARVGLVERTVLVAVAVLVPLAVSGVALAAAGLAALLLTHRH